MPFGWIDPEVFLTHGDVTIYHVYKDDEIAQGRREYWYTTDLSGGDYEDPCSFDVRDLPSFTPEKSHEQVIIEAIKAGVLPLSEA